MPVVGRSSADWLSLDASSSTAASDGASASVGADTSSTIGSLSFDAEGSSSDVVDVAVSASTSAVAADEPLDVSASPRCEASAAEL